jgi:hypothetical protein
MGQFNEMFDDNLVNCQSDKMIVEDRMIHHKREREEIKK